MSDLLLLISGLVLLASLLVLLAAGFCLWRVHVLGSWLLDDENVTRAAAADPPAAGWDCVTEEDDL